MASSSSSNSTPTSWMPAQGKYPVTIGSSLGRALKTRKQGGTPPATNSKRNLPDKNFYSFRYNFKPPSIDPTKPGSIEVRKGKDKTYVAVEHLSSQAGEAYVFTGNETNSKEWDCVLIYDEETGAYTLEKLDSFLNLTYERKRTPTTRVVSPIAPSPADRDAEGEDDGDLEKELLGLTGDLPPAKPKPQRKPPTRPPQKEEEEEDIEEMFAQSIAAQREPTPPLPPPAKPQPHPPKASRPTKPLPKARASAGAATNAAAATTDSAPLVKMTPPPAASPPKPKDASKLKKKKEPEIAVLSDPDVEDMEFGVPAKHAKTPAPAAAQMAPVPAAPSEGFALPGTSSSGIFRPPPVLSSAKAQRAPPAVPQQPTLPGGVEEDSEEEWEEVEGAAEPSRAMSYHSENDEENEDIFGDDVLAQELDEGMEELDNQDFLAAEMSKDMVEHPVPISLNKFAGGADESEEFSSSEEDESDED